MQTLKQAEAPFVRTLLTWLKHRLSRALAAIRTEHSAVAMVAIVARSGNPSGA